jgi:hypothetical protein
VRQQLYGPDAIDASGKNVLRAQYSAIGDGES